MSIRQGLKISLCYVIFSSRGCREYSGWVRSTMLALGLSRMAAMHFSQAVSPSQTACEVPVAPLSCLLHTHCFWASLCRLIPVLKLWFRRAWLSRVCAGGEWREDVDVCVWLHSEFMRRCQSLRMPMRFCQAPETLLDTIGFQLLSLSKRIVLVIPLAMCDETHRPRAIAWCPQIQKGK